MKAYEQQPKETTKAFAAFRKFRDQHPDDRTLLQTARACKVKHQSLNAWVKAHNWDKRVRVWDAESDKRRQAKRRKEIDAMNARQAKFGRMAQERAQLAMGRRLKSAKASESDIDALGELEAANLAEKGGKIERLAVGEPGEITEERAPEPTIDYSKLTASERLELVRLHKKLKT